MKKRIVIGVMLLVALLAMGVFLAACGGGGSSTTTLAATTTLAPTTTLPPATGGTIKIGHIRPISGVMATTSDRMIKAFDFAFEQVGYQVANKNIEIIIGDSKGDPSAAVEVARKMVEQDQVDMIVGPTQGGEEMGVAYYCHTVGIPVLFTNPAPVDATGPGFSMAVLGYGSEPMYSSAMADYAYKTLGYRNVDILAGDFTPGHGFLGAFSSTFTKLGGTIQQEIFTPYPSQDFSSYLTSLEDADAVVAWIDGQQAIQLLTQYHQLGVDNRMPLVGAFHGSFLAPFILSALPADVADSLVGSIVPVPYSPLLDNPVNEQFVADFQAKFGILPEDMDSGPYVGAQIILHALEATNGDTTPATLLAALTAVNFEGPEGLITFDPETRCAVKTIYIAEVAKQDDGAFVWDPIFTYTDVPAAGL
jgi:branched-chain amino acid transport system substrate-binding protein